MNQCTAKIKKGLLFCFFFVISITSILNGQQEKNIPDIEKIYLHTDRDYYILGEDLWYKAYVVNAFNHRLFSHSNVLYVELISSESKILTRHKTYIQEGLGHGDFKLTDSVGVKPGKYQIRAYTNYSRNFSNDFVFEKDIEIIDVFKQQTNEKEALNGKGPKKTEVNTISETPKIDVQFFPEGGSLLHNVPSVVAFKAEDNYGNPINVKGEVYDSNNQLVSLFLSVHDGMGKFQLKPNLKMKYYAKITTSTGVVIEKPLPEISETGYVLAFKQVQGKNIVSIKTNAKTLSENKNLLTVSCNTRGINYLEGTQKLEKNVLSFELPTDRFAEGISQITLYDANGRPQSERLVYIEKPNDLQVKVKTDQLNYKTESPVALNISSKTKKGEGVLASFSVSVIDTNGSENVNDFSSNICSQFLLESDIRGKINNPAYYFNSTNPHRLAHFNLLLLTQGWRDFLWKTMPKPKEGTHFEVESGFEISGRVKQLLGEKPKAGVNMTLALMGEKGMNIFNTETDSLGRFKFENLMFVGPTNMFLNSKNDRGKSRGEILIDPFEKEALPVSFSVDKTAVFDTVITPNKIIENVYRKYATFGIAPENVLDEVEIIAKKKKEIPSLYGTADFSYVPDENAPIVNDIYQYIQFAIPGVIVTNDTIRFLRFNGPAHIILNGFPLFNQSDIAFIQPDDIEKIDAIKGPSAAIFGSEGANGVIAIYTKEGATNTAEKKVYHSIKDNIEGFYSERVFYEANSDKDDFQAESKAAVRNTIYWDPYVHPDTTGTVRVNYKNTKVAAKAKITLEGITASGIPVVKEAYYTVEK